jgi:hypothetical protein
MESRTPVVVLGCYHEAQFVDPLPGYEWDQQRFQELIGSVVDENEIGFIGEEAKQGERSIAEEIAAGRGIRYANIDIPLVVQRKIHNQPPKVLNEENLEWESLLKSDKYAKAWSLVREFHMYQCFLEALAPNEPALLICGRLHVLGLVELMTKHVKTIPICFGPQIQ